MRTKNTTYLRFVTAAAFALTFIQLSAYAKEELTVFAAASLKEVFTQLGSEFEKTHSDTHVVFNFSGSQELRTQIIHGAKVDVFASADQKQMQQLQSQQLVDFPKVLVCNEPVLITPFDNPFRIESLKDLPAAKRLVLAHPEVPIGGYTLKILERASAHYGPEFIQKVKANIVSQELNVRQVLNKVILGEADAGIVYRTDALTAPDKVKMVALPPQDQVIAEYPIAVIKTSQQKNLATAFVNLSTSTLGRQIFLKAGFMECPKQTR